MLLRRPSTLRRLRMLGIAGSLFMLAAPPVDAEPATQAARVPTYRDMVRTWHTPPADDPPLTPEGRPTMVLEIINTSERVELAPERDDGGFGPSDLEHAAHALRDPHSDQECQPDPRLLDVAYQVEQHFHAKVLRVISAFRTPRRRHSRHGAGQAIDIVVPGTRDDEVARFARSLGFVGVGLYPRSGFVHLDVRDRSYFWVDGSAPGQRGRIVQVFAKAAALADARAIERGVNPGGAGSDGQDDDKSNSPSGPSTSSNLAAVATRRRSE